MPETDSVKAPEDGDVPAVSDAERRVRHYLADQDIYCPRCGYNLRGLQTEACPECDQRLELVIRRADTDMGMLIVTLFAAGFAGMLLAFVVTDSLIVGNWRLHPLFTLPFLGGFVAGTIPLLLLARRRGRAWFGRMNRSVQTRLAILAWALPVAFVIYLAVWFR